MSQNYNYPSSSEVTITGLGTENGAPIPSTSVLISGENPAGNQTVVQTDSAGNLIVSPLASSSTVTVVQPTGSLLHATIDASALPTGASTSALQTTGNTSLTTIIADLTNGTQTTQISQATPGTTNGVVVNSSALPTGASTSALQTTGNSSLSTIASNTTNLLMTETAPGTPATFALTVQGNASGVAMPVSLAASTGTSAVNVAQYGGTNTTLGLKVAAASMPVVIASDQVVPISATTLPLPTGASTLAAQTAVTGSATGGTAATSSELSGGVFNTTLPTLTTGQQVALQTDSKGRQLSIQSTPLALTITQAAVTVGTTAVRMTPSGSAPGATRVSLVVTPDSASTGKFYIGSSTVTSSGATRGIQIVAGQTFIANNDAGDYFIISDTAAQTVEIMSQE